MTYKRLRRHPAGKPATEVRDSVVSREGAVRPDGGVAAQPDSVESGASLLAEGVGHRRPVEGDRQPEPAGAPPAPAAQPLPATSGGDSAPASVPPTDPSRASARSPEVVGSETIPEARWVPVGEWYAQPAPSGGEGDCWQELIDSLPSNHPLRPACEARRLLGIERYGQPLRRGDGRSAVQDLRDELLDASVYAWRLGYEDLAIELIDTAQQWAPEDVKPEDESGRMAP